MEEQTRGARRRREILAAAADLSTVEGLESLSFGRLAHEVGLTKAGVAAHFESKEALQLAAVEVAARDYDRVLREAVRGAPPGLPRLRALAGAWLDHLDAIAYRGGCFFAAAGQVFAGRPGRVRDAIAEHTRALLGELEESAALAHRLGELKPGVDPGILTFQVHALAHEANMRRELLDEERAFDGARRALEALLALAERAPSEETRP